MADPPPFIEVQKFLAGMDYPATRDELVEHAKGRDADDGVLAALREIPDRRYEGPSGVSKEVNRASG